MNPEPIDRADQGQLRQVAIADADPPRRLEVAAQVVTIQRNQVPRPVDPVSPDLQPTMLGQHLLEPGVHSVGLERDGIVRSHPRTRRLPVAQSRPTDRTRPAFRSRPEEPNGRWPRPPVPAPANRGR